VFLNGVLQRPFKGVFQRRRSTWDASKTARRDSVDSIYRRLSAIEIRRLNTPLKHVVEITPLKSRR
jgi:hypothetical protein